MGNPADPSKSALNTCITCEELLDKFRYFELKKINKK
jgi:hypothetical protein